MKAALKDTETEKSMLSRLGDLRSGQRGVVVKAREHDPVDQRLLEMGMLEGAIVEVVHEAPISRDPIVTRVRGTLIALRRNEANHIQVRVIDEMKPTSGAKHS